MQEEADIDDDRLLNDRPFNDNDCTWGISSSSSLQDDQSANCAPDIGEILVTFGLVIFKKNR